MLNISNNSINRDEVLKDQSAYQDVMETSASRRLVYLLSALLFVFLVILMLIECLIDM